MVTSVAPQRSGCRFESQPLFICVCVVFICRSALLLINRPPPRGDATWLKSGGKFSSLAALPPGADASGCRRRQYGQSTNSQGRRRCRRSHPVNQPKQRGKAGPSVSATIIGDIGWCSPTHLVTHGRLEQDVSRLETYTLSHTHTHRFLRGISPVS